MAPEGCTQYFFGDSTGAVQTFNFDGGLHLANQNQAICVRKERGNCRICWTAENSEDLAVSNVVDDPGNMGSFRDSNCCRYGNMGIGTKGYDCFVIPGARKDTEFGGPADFSRFCGRNEGIFAGIVKVPGMPNIAAAESTVCSKGLW